MITLKIEDVRRATLPLGSGNEGWIGVSPAGDHYHTVVPVDAQIAKGVMACNRPTDGTPFGGYSGWLYFRCEPYFDEGPYEREAMEDQVRWNCQHLVDRLASHGIQARIQSTTTPPISSSEYLGRNSENNIGTSDDCAFPIGSGRAGAVQTDSSTGAPHDHRSVERHEADAGGRRPSTSCSRCGRLWGTRREFCQDFDLQLIRYRACPEDFRRGSFIFLHSCGNMIEIPVDRFVRSRSGGWSLIGSHACPGLCYYESSFRSCSARCEGSRYRRVAAHLKLRKLGRETEDRRNNCLHPV